MHFFLDNKLCPSSKKKINETIGAKSNVRSARYDEIENNKKKPTLVFTIDTWHIYVMKLYKNVMYIN